MNKADFDNLYRECYLKCLNSARSGRIEEMLKGYGNENNKLNPEGAVVASILISFDLCSELIHDVLSMALCKAD